ncbi:hypothetical protein [Acetobacter persici]|uniref:hypothetical protein n=1 Tax=Acetobacter persici TaxID=1076596 RepID=UPI0039E936AE
MTRLQPTTGSAPSNEKWREAVHETLRKTLLYIWEQPNYTPLQARQDAQNSKTHSASTALVLSGHIGG